MLLLVSSGVGLWLLGVEPLAVCCGEGGVGACAAFEFADPGRVGVQVVGGLGEGESSFVAQSAQVVGAGCGLGVGQQVPCFAGDGAFEAAQYLFAVLARGGEAGGVGLGARVAGQADQGDLVQRPVGLSVAAAVESVAVGLPGAGGDRGGAAQGGEGGLGADSAGVVAGAGEQGGGG